MIFKFNERIHIFLVGAIAFLLPYPRILPPLIVLLAINWLCAPRLIIPGLKNSLHNCLILPMVILYLLYIIGMLYTDNFKSGGETIETKLSFLILPLVFSSYALTTRNNLNKYLKWFFYGAIVNAVVCFVWAAYRYFKPAYVIIDGISYNLGANYFYYTELSAFMHPSYISMYCAFALMIFIYLVKINELKFNWKWGITILLLVVYILLLSSKAGWVGLCLIILYLVRNMILKKHASYAILIISILLGLFFVINIYFTPSYSARIPKLSVISQTLKDLDNKQKNAEITDGTRSRILVWKSATEIIKDNFLVGVGTGDAKDKMLEKYLEKGMITEYKNKLNSHNQFLNAFVALGVVGFLALFLSLLAPL
jgi:O-antigen ligase